jgi:segregation and condensation protein B
MELKNILESLLFIARKPLSPEEVVGILNLPEDLIAAALEELATEYSQRGINIIKVAGGYLMGTNHENAEYVHNLLHAKLQTTLSPQALETLSIIAYKQPITRTEIERIRGVNSDGPVETLLQKKLIREISRSAAVGHPYLYGTTDEFLRHFGLKDLKELPALPNSTAEQEQIFKSALHE